MPIYLSLLKLIRLLATQYQCGIFVILIRHEFYFRNMSTLHDIVCNTNMKTSTIGVCLNFLQSKWTNWADLSKLDFDTSQKLWNALLVNSWCLRFKFILLQFKMYKILHRVNNKTEPTTCSDINWPVVAWTLKVENSFSIFFSNCSIGPNQVTGIKGDLKYGRTVTTYSV